MSKPGSMREAMPQVAAFIDDMREVFGADEINASIRKGMAGIPGHFWAQERGREVGTRAAVGGVEISAANMQIGPFNSSNKEVSHDRRR